MFLQHGKIMLTPFVTKETSEYENQTKERSVDGFFNIPFIFYIECYY
jgi:hypothetical protein